MVKGDGTFYGGYIVSDDQVTVQAYEKDGLRIDMMYKVTPGEHWIDLPLMHYIGYSVTNENGEEYTVMTGNAGNIRVLLDNSEWQELHIKYKEPVLFRIAVLISSGMLLLAVVTAFRSRGSGLLWGVRHG